MNGQGNQNQNVRLAPLTDETRLKRVLLAWANRWPDKPVPLITYETLSPDEPGMALLSAGRGAYIEQKWITGGYRGVYDFLLVYRVQPGDSPDARLNADETLDTLGEWLAAGPYPALGDQTRIDHVECTARSVVSGEDGEHGIEDHVLTMKLTYEVNENA